MWPGVYARHADSVSNSVYRNKILNDPSSPFPRSHCSGRDQLHFSVSLDRTRSAFLRGRILSRHPSRQSATRIQAETKGARKKTEIRWKLLVPLLPRTIIHHYLVSRVWPPAHTLGKNWARSSHYRRVTVLLHTRHIYIDILYMISSQESGRVYATARL